MSNNKIWIDVTDLKDWHGHLTGIQRVIYNMARRYLADSRYDTHAFAFDAHRKIFIEQDLKKLLDTIETGFVKGVEPPHHGGEQAAARGTKQLLKAAPRAVLKRIPERVKQRIPGEIKQAARINARLAIDLARHAKRAIDARTNIDHVIPSYEDAITLTSEDTVVIFGKTWDLPELIPVLGRLKMQHGFKLVHLIHDMIPILEPHSFGPGLFEPYTKCMFDVCSLSDTLLAQSQSTKRDIERFCKMMEIKTPPISVVRLGDEVLQKKVPAHVEIANKNIKPGNFILHVGTVEVRKNHALSYSTYREAALRGIDLPPMVIVGSRGWLVGDITYQMEHDPELKDKFIFLGGVSDEVLTWLYHNCRFTVFPSTYEGWGIPVGESLAYGKVCITSKTSSMPEIAGPLLDYISPYNAGEMLDQMIRFMDDKELAKKEQQIAKTFKQTSWDQTFKQVEAAVRTVK